MGNAPSERLSPESPLLARILELAVACGEDFVLSSLEFVLRREVPDRTVQAHFVVVRHVARDDAASFLERQRRSGPDALALERLVPALDLSVRLGTIQRRFDTMRLRRGSSN